MKRMPLPRFIKGRPVAALGAAAAMLLALLLLYLLLSSGSDRRVEAARRQGYPMSAAELDARYPHTTDADATASAVLEALSNPPVPFLKLFATVTEQDLKAVDWVALKVFFATNQESLRMLQSLPPGQSCRYPGSYQQGSKPPYMELRKAVLFLLSHALLAASEGDKEGSLRSLLAAGTLADSLKAEPVLLSQHVRDALWSATCSATVKSLNLTSFDETQLAELDRMLARAGDIHGLALGLIGERATTVSMLREPGTLAKTLTSGMSKTDRLSTTAGLGVLKATGTYQRDRGWYLDSMAKFIDIAQKPAPERYRLGVRESTNGPPSKLFILSRILMPVSERTFVREEEKAARITMARLTIAVERFRLLNGGALPRSAQELVPSYLASIPVDPFDGQPIRYKKLAHAYSVYSVGPNGTDDGGLDPGPTRWVGTGDLVYTVQRDGR